MTKGTVAIIDVRNEQDVGRPPVFSFANRQHNLLLPSAHGGLRTLDKAFLDLIPEKNRHRHFGSMKSSQALAQSVFGALAVHRKISLLQRIKAECGRQAFGGELGAPVFEHEVSFLGEDTGRNTSVDVWFDGPHRVAVEAKFSEAEFGTCSRPSTKESDRNYSSRHCKGTYRRAVLTWPDFAEGTHRRGTPKIAGGGRSNHASSTRAVFRFYRIF